MAQVILAIRDRTGRDAPYAKAKLPIGAPRVRTFCKAKGQFPSAINCQLDKVCDRARGACTLSGKFRIGRLVEETRTGNIFAPGRQVGFFFALAA
jgi:hypothetical protein